MGGEPGWIEVELEGREPCWPYLYVKRAIRIVYPHGKVFENGR